MLCAFVAVLILQFVINMWKPTHNVARPSLSFMDYDVHTRAAVQTQGSEQLVTNADLVLANTTQDRSLSYTNRIIVFANHTTTHSTAVRGAPLSGINVKFSAPLSDINVKFSAPLSDINVKFVSPVKEKGYQMVLSVKERQELFKLGRLVNRVCEKLRTNYFMYGKTLLESYRHHDLGLWESNIVIVVRGSDKFKLLHLLQKEGYGEYTLYSVDRSQFKYCRNKEIPPDTTTKRKVRSILLCVDMTFYGENVTHIWIPEVTQGRVQQYLIRDIVYPLHTRPLGAISVNAPRDSLLVILMLYGRKPRCRSSNSKKNSDSSPESLVPCEFLKGRMPFVHRRSLPNGILETLQFGGEILHSIKTEEPREAIALPYDLELPPNVNSEYFAKVQRLISNQVNANYTV